jgi:hypothetical protein
MKKRVENHPSLLRMKGFTTGLILAFVLCIHSTGWAAPSIGSSNDNDGHSATNTEPDDSLSDLGVLRQYRDDFLTRAKKGKLYTKLAFKISEKALRVLSDNPELMPQAMRLIEANKDAAIEGLNGETNFVIYNGDEVISFLHDYSKKAPLLLKFLTYLLRKEILKKQKKGELVFASK